MSIKPITILGQEVKVGKTVIELDIAKLHTRSDVKVPIVVQRGRYDGPSLLLIGGIHGNEVNGVEIVRQIIKEKLNRPKYGTIICIPVVNVFGFIHQDRQFPDGRDLNRVFPGNAKGSLASRFAHTVMTEIIPHVDYIIDFHTGGDNRFNYPQLRVNSDDAETLELAKVFGTKFILNSQHRERSFRQAAISRGKKVLLFEGGMSLHMDQGVTMQGVSGTMRVIHHLGMKDFSEQLKNMERQASQYLLHSSNWVRARHSGMYRKKLNLGQSISKGDIIGSISDPFGEFEKQVKANWSGFVICSNQAPLVNQGDALIHIAYNEEKL